jgi:MoxR-like ATPase
VACACDALRDDPAVRPRERVLDVDATGLLERDEQLAALAAALTEVSERRLGRLLLVHGEAGIGKTALLRRFCARSGESARVLWATCDPLFTPRPPSPTTWRGRWWVSSTGDRHRSL